MLKKYSYKSIVSFLLIVSTILMPLSFLPKKAEAQANIYGYTSGLAPAIARLPQCQEMVGSGIKSLFNGIGDLFSGVGGEGDNVPNLPEKGLSMGSLSSLSTINTIPVDPLPSLDEKSSSKTIQVNTQGYSDIEAQNLLKKINTNLKEIAGDTTAINTNSSCLQSIGRLIIKMLLQKLTMSTVLWINNGFDGSPSFIQDPGKFFNDIKKTEILQFGMEIQDNPFGKDWMRNQALAYKTKFADNAQYSLNELIKQNNSDFSAETFRTDFSMGGWDAWTAMTQVPANNPLGAKLLFDNEIQKRLAGTSQSTAEQVHEALSQANGFLGDQRCISPGTGQIDYNVTYSEYQAGLEKTPPIKLCSGWEYVTPGKMISDAATNVIGYQNNAYLNVQDLNDAVAAISDAILNQFSSNLYEKGFANMGYQGIDGVLVSSGVTTDLYKTQTKKDFMPSQLSSSWLQANPDFNIRTDLTQALIDEQRTYSDKLALQNKELLSTTDGQSYKLNETTGVSNTYGLMPVIYQLDYCIPGPHPGWEDDSRQTLREVVLPQEKKSSNIAGQVANGAIGVGLNFVPYVGPVLSSLFGALTGQDEAKRASTNARNFYTTQFWKMTGFGFQAVYGLGDDPKAANMANSEGFFYVIDSTLNKYINIMKKTYFSSPDILPTVAKEAAVEFEKLPGYNQMIKENNKKILELKTTVGILGEIKDAVDELNTEFPDGGDEYENKLKTQINAFGRLSSNMVNGEDIAAADDLVKQIISKKDYLYDHLLKGQYGCEADLEKTQKNFPSAGGEVKQTWNDWSNYNVNSVERMTYPFPIIYDYGHFAKGATLPDPWESGYAIDKLPKMPTENKYDQLGPGFLSFVYFGATYASNNDNNYNGGERLNIGDLVNDYDPCGEGGKHCGYDWVSLGKLKQDSIAKPGLGLFEKTIGIY